VLLPVRTVGVMGDGRTYDQACALRAVTSIDGMTADYCPLEHAFLGGLAARIINECRDINRVTYDITSEPPGSLLIPATSLNHNPNAMGIRSRFNLESFGFSSQLDASP